MRICLAGRWSSLVEGDEQTILAKSQTNMECWHVCATYYLGGCNQQNSLPLGSIKPSTPSSSTKELHGWYNCKPLVSDQHDDHIWVGVLPGILQPRGQVVERVSASDVVNLGGQNYKTFFAVTNSVVIYSYNFKSVLNPVFHSISATIWGVYWDLKFNFWANVNI